MTCTSDSESSWKGQAEGSAARQFENKMDNIILSVACANNREKFAAGSKK